MSVWQADWQASRLASKWVKKEMHEGHMTGDNEEVSESRGTSVYDCRHEGLLIVQRRAGWVWGAASMYAFTCTSSALRTVFIGSWNLSSWLHPLSLSIFYHLKSICLILGMNWIEYSMLCIYSSRLPIPRSILGRRNNSQRAQYWLSPIK